jgi:hypothetical protein
MYPNGSLTYRGTAPLDPCQNQAYDAFKGQKRITSWPYYSRVKFYADKDVEPPGPFTYNLAAGVTVRAFAYAVGDQKLVAGYTNADGNATIADTNLSARNQTIGGQNVIVHGIACQLLPSAMHLSEGDSPPHRIRPVDYQFFAALCNSVAVEATLNGDENVYRLGTMQMIPGAGGVVGGAPDLVGMRGLAGDQESQPYAANGWQTRSNFFRLPEGLIWRSQSNADSMFNVRFTTTRPIRLFSGGSPENNANGTDTAASNDPQVVATGTQGYAYPSELAIEMAVILIGEVIGPRTRTA